MTGTTPILRSACVATFTVRRHHGAVQALVEQQVGATGQVFPLGEGAEARAVQLRFVLVVDVVPRAAAAALAIAAEHVLELGKQVRLLAEMAEVVVTPERASTIACSISARS